MVDFRDIKYCCIGIEINKFELKKRPVLASQNVTGADGYLLVEPRGFVGSVPMTLP